MKDKFKKAQEVMSSNPRDCYTFYTEEEYQEMLCKFGPEGLWIIADKLKAVAMEDVDLATAQANEWNSVNCRNNNRTFKVVGRYKSKEESPSYIHGIPNRIAKKRVYTSLSDFENYGQNLIERYSEMYNVEVYELINDKWNKIRL